MIDVSWVDNAHLQLSQAAPSHLLAHDPTGDRPRARHPLELANPTSSLGIWSWGWSYDMFSADDGHMLLIWTGSQDGWSAGSRGGVAVGKGEGRERGPDAKSVLVVLFPRPRPVGSARHR